MDRTDPRTIAQLGAALPAPLTVATKLASHTTHPERFGGAYALVSWNFDRDVL